MQEFSPIKYIWKSNFSKFSTAHYCAIRYFTITLNPHGPSVCLFILEVLVIKYTSSVLYSKYSVKITSCCICCCRPPKVTSRTRLDQLVLQEKDENGIDENLHRVRQLQREVIKHLEVSLSVVIDCVLFRDVLYSLSHSTTH